MTHPHHDHRDDDDDLDDIRHHHHDDDDRSLIDRIRDRIVGTGPTPPKVDTTLPKVDSLTKARWPAQRRDHLGL